MTSTPSSRIEIEPVYGFTANDNQERYTTFKQDIFLRRMERMNLSPSVSHEIAQRINVSWEFI